MAEYEDDARSYGPHQARQMHANQGGDDLCDLCMSSGVTVDRTTYCGLTIGVECGCDDANGDGTCDNPDCVECAKAMAEQDEEDRYPR